MAGFYTRLNRSDEAQRILAEARKQPQPFLEVFAFRRSLLAENDDVEIWKWLDKAYDERDPFLMELKVDPLYDYIRGDPRFKALPKKIGFE